MSASPPSKGSMSPPLPTPTFGPGGTFSISCSSRIAAPPSACLEVTLNAESYSSWNRFCRKCTIDSQPAESAAQNGDDGKLKLGTQFTFDVHMPPASSPDNATITTTAPTTTTALEVSLLEPIDEPWSSNGRPSVFPSTDDDDTTVSPAPSHGRRKGWRVAWRQRNGWLMPGWMLRSERVQEFVEVGEGQTAYYCWETFYGVLAPVVRMVAGAGVERGFGLWMEGLKGKVEADGED